VSEVPREPIEFDSHEEHLRFDLEMAFTTRSANWFTAELFRLIAKADEVNRIRLGMGFPEEVRVFEAWKRGAWKLPEWER
jgi:hypothetical protein